MRFGPLIRRFLIERARQSADAQRQAQTDGLTTKLEAVKTWDDLPPKMQGLIKKLILLPIFALGPPVESVDHTKEVNVTKALEDMSSLQVNSSTLSTDIAYEMLWSILEMKEAESDSKSPAEPFGPLPYIPPPTEVIADLTGSMSISRVRCFCYLYAIFCETEI